MTLDFLFPCDECRVPVDPEWWYRSGRLCGDCLANYAMPIMTTEEFMELLRVR